MIKINSWKVSKLEFREFNELLSINNEVSIKDKNEQALLNRSL